MLLRQTTPTTRGRGQLLNILLGGTFLLSILIFLATITLLSIYSAWGQQGVNLIFLALIICGIGCLLLLWLNQHSPRLTGMLFLLLLSTAFVFSDTPFSAFQWQIIVCLLYHHSSFEFDSVPCQQLLICNYQHYHRYFFGSYKWNGAESHYHCRFLPTCSDFLALLAQL